MWLIHIFPVITKIKNIKNIKKMWFLSENEISSLDEILFKSIKCSAESWGLWRSIIAPSAPPSDLAGSPPLGLRRGCCASVGPVRLSFLGWSLGDWSGLSLLSDSYSSFLLRLLGVSVCFGRQSMSLVPEKENKEGKCSSLVCKGAFPTCFIEQRVSLGQQVECLPAGWRSCNCCGPFRWRLISSHWQSAWGRIDIF